MHEFYFNARYLAIEIFYHQKTPALCHVWEIHVFSFTLVRNEKKIRMERRLSWTFLVEISEKFRKCCIYRMKSRNWNMTSVGLVRFFVECLHDSQSCIQAMSDVF